MSDKWTTSLGTGTLSAPTVCKFDQVGVNSFVNDLIGWYYRAYSKTCKKPKWWPKRIELRRSTRTLLSRLPEPNLKHAVENCRVSCKQFDTVVPTVVDSEIMAPKQENRVDAACRLPEMQAHIENASTVRLHNWSPVVKVVNRLRRLKRLNAVSVRVTDVLRNRKCRVPVSVRSNFGCDETVVKVLRPVMRDHPKLLLKLFIKVDDILALPSGANCTKREFMAYLRLHHVNSPTVQNHAKQGTQKFLRSNNVSNIPWSSELGMLLRKPTDVQALIRLERIERFLNTSSTASASKAYPVTFSKPPQDYHSHSYKFPNRQQRSKRVSLKAYAHANLVKPVTVAIRWEDVEAVIRKLGTS